MVKVTGKLPESQPLDGRKLNNIGLGMKYPMMDAQLKSKHLPKIGKSPWGEVTDWYSWDSMPTVVIRDPADGTYCLV